MTNEQPSQLGSDWDSSRQEAYGTDSSMQQAPVQMPWQGNGPQGGNLPQQWHQGGHAMQAPAHLGNGPLGKIRGTGIAILLMIVTLGIYGIYWTCASHSEMKKHTGQGVGGVGAFFLSFVPFVMMFLTPSEAGRLYLRRNRHAPVSAMTGCWTFIPFVGVFIWFAQINGALNDYWRSMGAVEG